MQVVRTRGTGHGQAPGPLVGSTRALCTGRRGRHAQTRLSDMYEKTALPDMLARANLSKRRHLAMYPALAGVRVEITANIHFLGQFIDACGIYLIVKSTRKLFRKGTGTFVESFLGESSYLSKPKRSSVKRCYTNKCNLFGVSFLSISPFQATKVLCL